jgi:GAF domain-containing protein
MTDINCTLPDILTYVDHPRFPWALECVFRTFNELISIDPAQSWRKILGEAAHLISDFLGAQAASIRLHEPHLNQLVSFGSYHLDESDREVAIPLEDTVAGRVVSTGHSQVVEDIASNFDYQNKGVLEQGLRSMMAVPLIIPRFSEVGDDIRGALQVYYAQGPRAFSPVEILTAELMAQRVSHVIARKSIMDMRRVNQKKEWLVEKIFSKISLDRSIKMKELFRLLVEQLDDIIRIQSCSLFALGDDGRTAVLETGWPEEGGYHTIGQTFDLDEHPYLQAAVRQDHPLGDFENERVYPSYLLIKNPQASPLTTENLRNFARTHGINSILYTPLRIGDRVRYLVVFDALDKRRFFSDEEIEILTFFGKQLTQALEIERLDDILHDFKNPAIAVAGFGRRIKKMLERGDANTAEMLRFIEVVIHEGTRLQEMAMSLYPLSRPEVVDLSAVALDRFLINEEAIREQKRTGIALDASGLAAGLLVETRRLGLERVLDNLLNNATKAIPAHGGFLKVRTCEAEGRAHLEISNSGRISPEEVARIRAADVSGRGLNIIYRFVTAMGGEVDVDVQADSTTFRVSLPLVAS